MSSAASAQSNKPTPQQIVMQIGTGFIPAACLNGIASFRIPDQLAAGPKPVEEIAAKSGLNPDALYRAMRVLAMVGIFSEVAPRTFALTELGQVLRSDTPGNLAAMLEFMGSRHHFHFYSEMRHALKTGESTVEKCTGVSCFDLFERDAEYARLFDAAMTNYSQRTIPGVLEAYDFSGVKTLVDVAGGHGFVLGSILQEYPAMRGILFDVERVIAGARPLLESLGVADRVQLVAGDFFKSVPAADTYIMQHIIHDWDDDRAALILRNCRAAMQGTGRVIVLDAVVPAGDQPDFSKLLDIEMMLLPGGKERTEQEFARLFSKAGLKLSRIVPTPMIAIVEAVPA